jgi:membrane protease YdiL (CAAX protease family)
VSEAQPGPEPDVSKGPADEEVPPPPEGEHPGEPNSQDLDPREAPLSPRFHSARQALGLLVVAYVLHLLIGRAAGWNALARDLAPALEVMVWISPAYWLLQRQGEDPLIRHGVTSSRRGLWPALGISLALLLAFVGVCALLSNQPAEQPRWGDLLRLLPAQLVFVALKEEYFFRGVLQPALERPEGPGLRILGAPMGRGAVAAAALFALAHLDPFQGPSPGRLLTFFPALWFAWLRARTGSILPALLGHAAANLTGEACLQAFGVGFGAG